MTIKSANLGFPRVGINRELKKSLELFWKGNESENGLLSVAKDLRKKNWQLQKDMDIDYIPCNDFSLYDHVLDTICLLGAVPSRYNHKGDKVSLDTYFSMARGKQSDGIDVGAMEMTKWFDTNYHYIVPEFKNEQEFKISSSKIFDEFTEAKELGINARPVLLGPISFLLLGKMEGTSDNNKNLKHLDKLVAEYEKILVKLADLGAKAIQIDEPHLATDLSSIAKDSYTQAYKKLSSICKSKNIELHIASYFASLDDNIDLALSLGADLIHIDLVRAKEQLDSVLNKLPNNSKISLGIVDGRNIWINNLENSLEIVKKVVAKIGADKVVVAPSCSLLHSPIDLDGETELNAEIRSWLAFAKQKLAEIRVIKNIVNNNQANEFSKYLADNQNAIANRKTSKLVNNQKVKDRVASINNSLLERKSPYSTRKKIQEASLNLPILPTTTIGSFPQTNEVRKARADYKKGLINDKQYNDFLKEETKKAVAIQEEIGLDVLVHGEFERNDMVEYFGEQLQGYAFTKNGWVQSYGSRCVKPPVIFGDVSREQAMTVEWSVYAQSLTKKHMKGMLTGPVTILQWSFVRDDQPRKVTCQQIAFAIRDEVADLEKNGIKIIQIDEPAIREGLPIRNKDKAEYLRWAVDCFRLSASVARDETQIHTHMCYAEFNDIITSVAEMDADVISIETSRSKMELLDAFVNFKYPNDIGPGLYDIHSPRVPSHNEMEILLDKAIKVLPVEQLWVNPDCGLKTRGWKETKEALIEMVATTNSFRNKIRKTA